MAYIEREKVLEIAKDEYYSDFHKSMADLTSLRELLEDTPVADVVEVRHGEWDINSNCSVCGVYKFEGLDADVWADWDIDYCPHCGAKMDRKDGE